MPYRKDGFVKSFVMGRIGAVIASMLAAGLVAAGYIVTPEDTQSIEILVAGIMATISGVLAAWSKIREAKKLDDRVPHPDDFKP